MKCTVIQRSQRTKNHIKNALKYLKSEPFCQFTDLPAEYAFEGEHFCLMHLPVTSPEKNDLKKDDPTYTNPLKKQSNIIIKNYIERSLAQGNVTINLCFIQMTSLSISNISPNYISALYCIGSELVKVDLTNIEAPSLTINFNYSKIQDFRISNSTLNKLNFIETYLTNTLLPYPSTVFQHIPNYFWIFNTTLDVLKIEGAYLNAPKFYGIDLSGSKIKILNLINTKTKGVLNFKGCAVEELVCNNTTFEQSPSFFGLDTKKLIKSHLPIAKDFKTLFDQKKDNGFWKEQYLRFREIYNITRDRKMYQEQGDYFYLMQKCFCKNKENSWWSRHIGQLYGAFSNYGQSLWKPLAGLVGTWFVGMCLLTLSYSQYPLSLDDLGNAALISAQQIISPYSLLDKNQQIKTLEHLSGLTSTPCYGYFISLLESSLSLAFLGMFILALRWNFRKA